MGRQEIPVSGFRKRTKRLFPEKQNPKIRRCVRIIKRQISFEAEIPRGRLLNSGSRKRRFPHRIPPPQRKSDFTSPSPSRTKSGQPES
jgi:hypothetical protein